MVWNKVALSSSFIGSGTQRRSRNVREGNVSSFAVFVLCVKAETSLSLKGSLVLKAGSRLFSTVLHWYLKPQ